MNSTTKVTIEVLDVNNNVPVFTKAEYNATVNENSEPQKVRCSLSSSSLLFDSASDVVMLCV